MSDKSPADKVTNDVGHFIEYALSNAIGTNLRHLAWDGDEDDDDPYQPLVVKDLEGRRFEIDYDVSVTELTDAVLAERAAFVERLKAFQAQVQGAAGAS